LLQDHLFTLTVKKTATEVLQIAFEGFVLVVETVVGRVKGGRVY
jgi:hypothetical protein